MRRLALWFLVTALVVASGAFVARRQLLTSVGHLLLRVDPLVKADAILVLAGGTPQRELEAADLYLAGYAPKVLLTIERRVVAAEILRKRGIPFETATELKGRILRTLGVPEPAIVFLDGTRATSTRMETELVKDWVAANPVRRIIIVTSPYHTQRSWLTLSRLLRDSGVEVLAHPASYERWEPDGWWRDREQLKIGLVEIQKLGFYYLAYWRD